MLKIEYCWMQGGNVPGGHNLILDIRKAKPFIPPMHECNSIPLCESDVVVDIGAYVGTYAIRCARFPVKHVDAYEATSRSYEILNLTQLPNLKAYNYAVVGDNRKSVDFFLSRGIGVSNSTVARRGMEKITVPAIRYEKVVEHATIVKIDVEGAEYSYNIVQPNLRAIIIDFHPIAGINWIKKAEGLIKEFTKAGFTAVVKPDWSNGWTMAGSWVRPMLLEGSYLPMTNGKVCCGCGKKVKAKSKALCPTCWNLWLPKHRIGFIQCMEV